MAVCAGDEMAEFEKLNKENKWGGNIALYNWRYPYCQPYPTPPVAVVVCFSGIETVQVVSGEVKLISDVLVGDKVLSSDVNGVVRYTAVVSVIHLKNSISAIFHEITTSSGKAVRMTPEHLVPTGSCSSSSRANHNKFTLMYASSVKLGSCLMTVDGPEVVVTNTLVEGIGVYSFVTQDEYIVVSGIIASPFALNHAIGNKFYDIYRMGYKFLPSFIQSKLFMSAHAAFSNFCTLFTFV